MMDVGIVSYSLGANKYFPAYGRVFVHRESDDVSISIVIEVLLIDLQQVIIITEDIMKYTQSTITSNDDLLNPA